MLEVVEQRGPLIPVHRLRALHHVVAEQRRDRDERHVRQLESGGEAIEILDDLLEHLLVEVDEIHLVDAHDDVPDAQERADERMALGLRQDSLARIDQHDRKVGGRGAGNHVSGVLLVTGRVGDDEPALRGREVAVRDVDRDALLTLCAQAIGQQRQIHEVLATTLAGLLNVRQLVGEDLFGVVQQAPDQRALAVVDRASCGEAQQLGRTVGQPSKRLAALNHRLGDTAVAALQLRACIAVGFDARGTRRFHQQRSSRLRSSAGPSARSRSGWPRAAPCGARTLRTRGEDGSTAPARSPPLSTATCPAPSGARAERPAYAHPGRRGHCRGSSPRDPSLLAAVCMSGCCAGAARVTSAGLPTWSAAR